MKKIMLTLIILAGLIPGILAVVQYFDNERIETENKISETALNNKIDSLKIDNNDLKSQLKVLMQDNTNLSHQLTETALKLNENVIGGGDLEIELNTTKPSEFVFRFVNNSEQYINNANIVIQDYSKIIKCEILRKSENQIHISGECYQDKHSRLNGINFNPYGAQLDAENIRPFVNGYMNYAIRISTRKKTYFYHLVYKVIDGSVKRSFRIYNLVNDKMIFEKEENDLHLPVEYWKKNFYTKILYTD